MSKHFNPLKQQFNAEQIDAFMQQLMQTDEFQLLNSSKLLTFVSSRQQLKNGTLCFKINLPSKYYDAKCLLVYASGYFRGAPYQHGQSGLCIRYGCRMQKYYPIDRLQFNESVSMMQRYVAMLQRMIKYATKHKLL